MNERIRECWLKAAREDSSETWDTQEQFIERFAELIVRESIVDFYRRYLDLESEEDITEQVNRYVKDNFGVER